MSRSRRLALPRPTSVQARADGVPAVVQGARVETVREEWLVEDRWWTTRPLRRRYFELVLANGRNSVVFRDLPADRWYAQQG